MVIGWVLLGPRTPRLLTPGLFLASFLPAIAGFAPAVIVAAVTGFWSVARLARYEFISERAARRCAAGRCPACGYSMREVEAHLCPECGRDPAEFMLRLDRSLPIDN